MLNLKSKYWLRRSTSVDQTFFLKKYDLSAFKRIINHVFKTSGCFQIQSYSSHMDFQRFWPISTLSHTNTRRYVAQWVNGC